MSKLLYSELAYLALVNGEYEAAESFVMQNARVNQFSDRQVTLHLITAWIALGREQLEKARSPICLALSYNVQKRHGFPVSAQLAGAALLMSKSGHTERALELYGVSCQNPHIRNSRWYEDVFGKHIKKAAEALPAEVVEAALNRGRVLDLWETAENLLEELNEG
ncbi:MAG: hypothetical protein P1S60_11720 [Anaerolineae bacterium]|nr:hypothetical protein [Anaerolineae bacterium]